MTATVAALGVEIVNEAAVFALFRFFVMLHEAR